MGTGSSLWGCEGVRPGGMATFDTRLYSGLRCVGWACGTQGASCRDEWELRGTCCLHRKSISCQTVCLIAQRNACGKPVTDSTAPPPEVEQENNRRSSLLIVFNRSSAGRKMFRSLISRAFRRRFALFTDAADVKPSSPRLLGTMFTWDSFATLNMFIKEADSANESVLFFIHQL